MDVPFDTSHIKDVQRVLADELKPAAIANMNHAAHAEEKKTENQKKKAVSYTHLTLPTT